MKTIRLLTVVAIVSVGVACLFSTGCCSKCCKGKATPAAGATNVCQKCGMTMNKCTCK